jgi:hypothetical protein
MGIWLPILSNCLLHPPFNIAKSARIEMTKARQGKVARPKHNGLFKII